MTASVIVTYAVKPECLEEHLGLIGAVFASLDREAVAGVDYQVHRGADCSFAHVATFAEDGVNPLPALAAFQDFTRDLSARVVAPPSSWSAAVAASYTAPSRLRG